MAHPFVHRFGPPSPSWDSGLRRAGLILGACVASLLSIAVLLMVLQPALPAPSPASILPAGRTLALFPSLTPERLRDFTGLFPMLSAISPHDGVAIALVEYSCGPSCTDIGRVSLSEESMEGSEKIGNWHVVSPSPALTSLLSATATGRLITDASFQDTMKNRATDIYLSPGALPSSPNLTDRMLMALLQGSHAIALGETNSGWTLTVSGTQQTLSSSVASSIVTLPGEILTLTVGDAGDLWKKWEENLDAAQKRILYSLVGGEVARYAGPNVSFTYDVLPLLQKPAVLHLAKSGSAVRFALTGSTDDRVGMQASLERMEISVRDHLPQTAVLARTFDENFSSVLIKQEAALLDTQEVTQDSWKLRSVFHKETNEGIVTAFSADRFAISNDVAFLSAVLSNDGERIPFRSAIAGGQMDLTALRQEITTTPWKQALLGPVLRYEGPLTWHIEREGDVTTVSFQKR